MEMKNISDKITPEFLHLFEDYLIKNGWEKLNENNVLSIWNKKDKPTFETALRLPKVEDKIINDDVDFALLAVKKLADYFESTPELIISSIMMDVSPIRLGKVSFRFIGDSVENGELPLLEGVSILPSIKKLLESFAKSVSVKSKQAHYSQHKSPLVKNFLDTLKLGQTEKGSYIINVSFPMVYENKDQQLSLDVVKKFSFAGSIQNQMVESLTALKKQLDSDENLEKSEIKNLINSGISVNLCNSLIKLTGKNNTNDVEIRINSSQSIENEENDYKDYLFKLNKVYTEKISLISKKLDGELFLSEYSVVGTVVKRFTPAGSLMGHVTVIIKAEIFEKNRTIEIVELDDKYVEIPEQAVKNNNLIKIVGDLYLNGSNGRITNVKDVTEFKKLVDEPKLI